MNMRINPWLWCIILSVLVWGCEAKSPEEKTPAGETAEKSAPSPMSQPAEESSMEESSSEGPHALMAPAGSKGQLENDEGVTHYQKNHYNVAEENFRKAVATNPDLAQAHYNLALALDKLGNHGEATEHFKKALELAPDNPEIKDSPILKAHVG